MISAEEIINFFNMKPLPQEGGYYTETYRADETLSQGFLSERYSGNRCLGTAILYLLTPNTFSALHRLKSDEIFHFYLGDPVTMLKLREDGDSEAITFGQDILSGHRVQAVVEAGTWQGTFLNEGGKFSLLGTTMAPGFEYDDFELAQRDKLLELYPSHRELVFKLTKPE
ncbi:MAG: cupin domain-containing protein [Planctomycetota bacterium]|jgi:predicted cupin superfamily sugar epimerase